MATDVSLPLVLFAMDREAAPFGRLGLQVQIGVSGIGRTKAREAIEAALTPFAPRKVAEPHPNAAIPADAFRGANGDTVPHRVIAAGFCGALDPSLKIGDIVTSPHILTVDHLVGDPPEKARLFEQTGKRAVDMESAAIEEVCAERGIPFTAVRAVSDTSDTALSPELVKLLSGGQVSVRRAVCALLRRPSLLKEFLRLRRDTKLAADQLATALASLLAAD